MIAKIAASILAVWTIAGAGAISAQAVGEPSQQKAVSPHEAMADMARRVSGFGGLYLDSNGSRLNVHLLEPRAKGAVIAAIAAVFGPGRFPKDVRVLQGQYDYRELIEWNDHILNVLTLPGVSYKGIDDAQNRLLIGLENEEARGRVEKALDAVGIPRDAVIIKVTGPVEFLSHTVRNRVRPAVGGLQIYQAISDQLCSLGFNAIRNGVAGFVTNSHCTLRTAGGADGSRIWQPLQASINILGVETVDPPYFDSSFDSSCPDGRLCRYSDAAFIRYDSDVEHVQGRIATTPIDSITIGHGSSSLRVTAKGYAIGVYGIGTPLQKIGRVTGRTQGTLDITCMDVNLANSNVTLLCQDGVRDAEVAQGDSGAPVFYVSNNPENGDVVLYGLLWGASSPTSYWFSAQSLIRLDSELNDLFICAPGFACPGP